MVKQVITVSPDGAMSGLQVKPGKGVDLRQFGEASIVRASEISWNDEYQAWFVFVIQTAGHGNLTIHKWKEAGLPDIPSGCHDMTKLDMTFLFHEYDDAVAAEITYLDTLRAVGVH